MYSSASFLRSFIHLARCCTKSKDGTFIALVSNKMENTSFRSNRVDMEVVSWVTWASLGPWTLWKTTRTFGHAATFMVKKLSLDMFSFYFFIES